MIAKMTPGPWTFTNEAADALDIESLHSLIQVSAKLHPAADNLRRILARIDGGDNG